MRPNEPTATALVVTSIHPPNAAMRELAAGCIESGWDFVVAGLENRKRLFSTISQFS